MKAYALVTALCLCSLNLFADGLGAPFDFEDTSMLPKGVRTIKLRSFTSEVTEKYDMNGSVQALGKPFQKNVKMSSLYQGKSASEAALSKGYMKSRGIDPDNTDLGTIDANAAARVFATVPVIGWGIRDNWSIALAVPIVYANTHVDTGFNISSKANDFFGYVSKDTNHNTTLTVKDKTSDPVNAQVTSLGYDPLNGETRTEIGDVRLINKVLVQKTDNYAIAIKQAITAPTGKPASYNKLVAVSSGDNQWDLSASLIGDWHINGKWGVSGYTGYTVQLADTTQKRIPLSSSSPLGYLDPNTERDLGDMAGAGLSVRYTITPAWSVASSYDAQIKFSDIYHGNLYQAQQYDWLSSNTNQQMESALVGVNFSTVPAFRRKEFAVPMDVKASYSWVLNGVNVPADDMISGEVAVYF